MGILPSDGDYRFNPLDRYLNLPDPLGEISKKPTYDKPVTDLSQQFIQKLADYNKQFNQAYQQQSQAARGYQAVINGTAPSVAQAQMQQGLGQIAQQQQSQASGAGGANAAIARIAAMQNTGAAQAQMNGEAALRRAIEIQQARAAQAQIYGQQAAEAGHGVGSYVGPTTQLTIAQQQAAQKEFEDNRAFWGNMMQAGGRAIVGGAAGGGAGAAAGSSGSGYSDGDGYMQLGSAY